MIYDYNYPNAYKEVYVILNNMEKQYIELIPQSFMDMIKNNMNKEYDFKLDPNKDFEEQEILQETKSIFAYIFMHYWGTEKQKLRINKKFMQDIINKEKIKSQYDSEQLFKNKRP